MDIQFTRSLHLRSENFNSAPAKDDVQLYSILTKDLKDQRIVKSISLTIKRPPKENYQWIVKIIYALQTLTCIIALPITYHKGLWTQNSFRFSFRFIFLWNEKYFLQMKSFFRQHSKMKRFFKMHFKNEKVFQTPFQNEKVFQMKRISSVFKKLKRNENEKKRISSNPPN